MYLVRTARDKLAYLYCLLSSFQFEKYLGVKEEAETRS